MFTRYRRFCTALLPGVALCLLVTASGFALERLEILLFGRAWLESLVLAILLGSAIRTFWSPPRSFTAGVQFSAKTLLEVAVVLLGASVSASAIAGEGLALIASIVVVVVVALCVSYTIGRALKLPHCMALLIACGNSICGNTAIAAAAPAIGADSDEIAGSIAFTAVLGVIAVLGLPLLMPLLRFSATQYGVFAGLTVYAVPQVLAATAPVGLISVQVGTLVKLVRVLMLGPVVLVLALTNRRQLQSRSPSDGPGERKRLTLPQLLPWFIIGFLTLMTLRSTGLIPVALDAPTSTLATLLTTVSMAALGLGVDARSVARAGSRVTCAVILSLLMLGLLSYGVIRLLSIA
ncbi:MAG TPA: putative sulfate exporter family transporter [Herbaspirillum sp.]|jgi:uncharacterized integral membrane protein (TIGR00698 family)